MNKMVQLTPLGSAIVEAMPDRKMVKTIKRIFRKSGQCPASALFSELEVKAFYSKKRTKKGAVDKIEVTIEGVYGI